MAHRVGREVRSAIDMTIAALKRRSRNMGRCGQTKRTRTIVTRRAIGIG